MKTKIVIVGLGGVGGYYGGLLARKYADNPDIEIFFIARGEHLNKVQKDGLTVITETETFDMPILYLEAIKTNNVEPSISKEELNKFYITKDNLEKINW